MQLRTEESRLIKKTRSGGCIQDGAEAFKGTCIVEEGQRKHQRVQGLRRGEVKDGQAVRRSLQWE